jgi:hypothetical protein
MNLTFLQLQALQCLVFVLVYENNPSHAQNFHKVDSWPHRSVTDLKIYGSAIAMTKSENEQIIFLHRSDKFFSNLPRNSTITNDTVLILDRQTGKILHSWGSDLFVKPHGIEVVEVGDIFITDVMLHQVFKVSDYFYRGVTLSSSYLLLASSSSVSVLPRTFFYSLDLESESYFSAW